MTVDGGMGYNHKDGPERATNATPSLTATHVLSEPGGIMASTESSGRDIGLPSDPNTHAGRLERWLMEARAENADLLVRIAAARRVCDDTYPDRYVSANAIYAALANQPGSAA
jgi:hypothetical protein